MNQWLRLWHDMPTDPKFRTVARLADRPLTTVIAVYLFMLTDASANATERGRTQANDEHAASALDLTESDVSSIRQAMQGRLLDGDRITGWEKRQPKREDNSAARAKAWRDAKKTESVSERDRTQMNAAKRPDKDTEITPKGPLGHEDKFDLSNMPRDIQVYSRQGINRDAAVAVECVRCGVGPGEPCQGLQGRSRTSPHLDRYQLVSKLRAASGTAPTTTLPIVRQDDPLVPFLTIVKGKDLIFGRRGTSTVTVAEIEAARALAGAA
jgi:hypothetical protein